MIELITFVLAAGLTITLSGILAVGYFKEMKRQEKDNMDYYEE